MQMQVLQWHGVKEDGLPKSTGRYLCCYITRGVDDWLYNVFEFNKNAQEFQFGYIGVIVTHWAEIPKVNKFEAATEMVLQEEGVHYAE